MGFHLEDFPVHGNTKPVLKAFRHSLKHADREACGIFVLDNFEFSFIPIENSFLKSNNYFIGDNEVFSRYLIDKKIFCLFHSHLTESVDPSDLDIEVSESLCLPSYIFSTSSKDSFLYYPKRHNPPDLYGRMFISHLQDCITFVKDFYLKKLNINLASQNKDWGRKGDDSNDYLITSLSKLFNPVKNLKDVRYGDILVLKPSIGQFFHLGVYSKNNKIAHHPYGMLSMQELITDGTWNQVYKVYRYKEI
jgi:proteasome lid subunit RPN8/RPN11